ncbi:MAG: twin-arginine translocation signal domain-containing protein, partial [Desulfovibrionaceae bacterium]
MSAKRKDEAIASKSASHRDAKPVTRRRFLKTALLGAAGGALFGGGLLSCAEIAGRSASRKRIQTVAIPALTDFHTHSSLYIALLGSESFWGVVDKAAAMKTVDSAPADDVTLVRGWNSNSFTFTAEELAAMPPVVIVHYSLHRIVMSAAAEEMLWDSDPEIVGNYKNQDWYEANISKVLQFLGRIPDFDECNIEKHF